MNEGKECSRFSEEPAVGHLLRACTALNRRDTRRYTAAINHLELSVLMFSILSLEQCLCRILCSSGYLNLKRTLSNPCWICFDAAFCSKMLLERYAHGRSLARVLFVRSRFCYDRRLALCPQLQYHFRSCWLAMPSEQNDCGTSSAS